jgi:hypothetical protein
MRLSLDLKLTQLLIFVQVLLRKFLYLININRLNVINFYAKSEKKGHTRPGRNAATMNTWKEERI